MLQGQDQLTNRQETGGGLGTVLGDQPELLAGAVQLVVDEVGESDNKDAVRREKLASIITVGGEGLSTSKEYLIRQCVLEANFLFALSKDER